MPVGVGGILEWPNDEEQGSLVPPCDLGVLAKQLVRIRKDSIIRLEIRAARRALARQDHNIENY